MRFTGCIAAILGLVLSVEQPALAETLSAKDTRTASQVLQDCDGGDAEACFSLGLRLHDGNGVRKNDESSAALFQRACDGGFAAGCSSLGWMYDKGFGVAQNKSRAATLYKRACDRGIATGCFNLGSMHDTGDGALQDLSQAVGYYERACNAGHSTGCYNLGAMKEAGEGTSTDTVAATKLYARACESGYQRACSRLPPVVAQATVPAHPAHPVRQQPAPSQAVTNQAPTPSETPTDWDRAIKWQQDKDREDARQAAVAKRNFIDATHCLGKSYSSRKSHTGQYTVLGPVYETIQSEADINKCNHQISFDVKSIGLPAKVVTLGPQETYGSMAYYTISNVRKGAR